MARQSTLILRWMLGGGFFGAMFPVIAWLVTGSGLSVEAIRLEHLSQPALWVVDLAPFVLAGAGALVGLQHSRVDAAMRSMDEQVKERTSELASAYEQLEALMASKDEFVAMVSHEVRNPLTVVLGFADELKKAHHFTSEETAELAALIADQSMEISNIIDDMLVAARADMGSLTIAAEEMDLPAAILQVVRACVCAASVRDSIEVTAAPARAWADPARVRQIIRNLISNAVRYGGDEISIVVEGGDVASICVCDNGAGIPVADRESVFEAYGQAADAKKVSGSVGLGLYVSRTLARAMGGDLSYRYENGHSVFELTVPGLAASSLDEPLIQAVG